MPLSPSQLNHSCLNRPEDELARTETVMIYGTPAHTWTHLNTPPPPTRPFSPLVSRWTQCLFSSHQNFTVFNNSCVTKWSNDEETSPLNPPQRDKHSFIHLFTDSHNVSVTASGLSLGLWTQMMTSVLTHRTAEGTSPVLISDFLLLLIYFDQKQNRTHEFWMCSNISRTEYCSVRSGQRSFQNNQSYSLILWFCDFVQFSFHFCVSTGRRDNE